MDTSIDTCSERGRVQPTMASPMSPTAKLSPALSLSIIAGGATLLWITILTPVILFLI